MINMRVFVARLAVFLAWYGSAPAIPTALFAQETTPPPHKLNIAIIEGEGEVNNIKTRVAREPIVEVTDENHKPIGGAIVTFTAPNSGPGGVFGNGSRFLTVTTDQNGRAVAKGFQPNNQAGRYSLRVTATAGGLTATAAIAEMNAAGAAAAAAGGGGLLGLGLPITIAIAGAAAAGLGVGLWKGFSGGARTARISVGPPSLP